MEMVILGDALVIWIHPHPFDLYVAGDFFRNYPPASSEEVEKVDGEPEFEGCCGDFVGEDEHGGDCQYDID